MINNIWIILFMFSCVAVLVTAIILLKCDFVGNKFYKPYHKDELIKTSNNDGTKNSLFFTEGETYRYIKKYILSESLYDKYVVANYNELYKEISFFILCYTKRGKKPFKVIEYSEYSTLVKGSKIVVVPKRTRKINIIIKSVNNTMINERAIIAPSKRRINFFAAFTALHVFFSYYLLMFGAAILFCPSSAGFYFRSIYFYGLLFISLLVSLFTFLLAKRSQEKKSKKLHKKGVVVEHDFA